MIAALLCGALLSAAPGQLVPVDSEHSALAQALRGGRREEVRRLVLTASGGPFRGRTRDALADVTPAEALAECRACAGGQFWPPAVEALARARGGA